MNPFAVGQRKQNSLRDGTLCPDGWLLGNWTQTGLWEIGTRSSANQRVRATKSLSCFSRVSSRPNGGPHEYWG
jgi:hypothetical protein